MVQSYARAEMIWQTSSVIINPRKRGGAGVWMTTCPVEMVLRIWRFWKDSSWVYDRWRGSWVFYRLSFSDLDRQRWIEILNTIRWAVRWGGVSIVWLAKPFKNCVSLLVSPLAEARNSYTHSFPKRKSPPVFVYMFVLLLWLISL